MRQIDRPEPQQTLGAPVRPAPAKSVDALRQVPGARPGVVAGRDGSFQTVPVSQVSR